MALASARRSPPAHALRQGPVRDVRRHGVQALRTCGFDLLEHVLGARRDRRAGAVDALDAGFVEEVVVLARDHAADEDDDVVGALRLQRLDDRRHQRLVAGGQRRHADRVDVVLDRLARALLGGLEQRPDVDVEAEVGERRGHHLGAAVVAVLAELGDHHPRAPALLVGERRDLVLELVPAFGTVVGGCIHPGHLLRVGAVAPADLLQRIADLAHRWRAARTASIASASRLPSPAPAAAVSASSAALHGSAVARGAQRGQAPDLVLAHRMVVDVEGLDRGPRRRGGTC